MRNRSRLNKGTAAVAALVLVVGTVGLAASAAAAGAQAGASVATHALVQHRHAKKRHVVLRGHICTVVATKRHRRVVGHAGDVVCGIRGNDTLVARGPGMVFLIAGPLKKHHRTAAHLAAAGAPRRLRLGRDTLIASSSPGAQDILIGGSGRDTFKTGTAGTDLVQPGTGPDTIDCTAGATITIAGDAQGDQEDGCQGQNVQDAVTEWEGTVTAIPSATTMAVQWAHQDGADAWLAANGNPNPVTFDISSATMENEDNAPLAVGDQVEVAADLPTSGTTLVAVSVDAEQGDNNSQGDSGGGDQGDGNQNQAEGTVTAVNGSNLAGTCGTAGATGTFTISSDNAGLTVNVSAATAFEDPADASPSFADVCLGSDVEVAGNSSAGAINATSVAVRPPENDN